MMMPKMIKFGGNPVELLGQQKSVGEHAPDFIGVGEGLKEIKSADYKGKIKVISVFPSIDTPVCALQAKRFNHEMDKLDDGVVILSVSCDLPFALARYCGAEGVNNIVMVSDHRQLDFGMNYGFVMKDLRLLARGVVVVDRDDQIRYVEYVPEVTNEPDYDKALACVKSLL